MGCEAIQGPRFPLGFVDNSLKAADKLIKDSAVTLKPWSLY